MVLCRHAVASQHGADLCTQVRILDPENGKKNGAVLIRFFLLEGVGGEADLNKEIGIHSNR
jgi:hypothetical protein